MEQLLNLINGELRPALGGTTIDVYAPATGRVIAQAPDSDERDVQAAVDAATKAFPVWNGMGVEGRSNALLRLADAIEQDMDGFVADESRDNGKPLSLARRVDIPRAVANLRFFATAVLHFNSEAHMMDAIAVNYTDRQPIGVVGCISPWNLPLYLFTWKIAPALAAGNCVVAKPSEITPITAYRMSKLCKAAGIPDGVLNIVHGIGPKVGAAITAHPAITAISFTGGTRTGAEIARVAAPMFKKLSLELGGKNAVLIFNDCDFEEMMKTTVRSSFTNQGQICLCGSRILVQRGIYDRFRDEFVKRVTALKVGDPADAKSDLGAVVSQPHMEKVLEHIRIAKEEGGTILCGGERIVLEGELKNGWYIAPTVIEGLGPQCRTNQEEIFGPVVTIQPFDSDADAVAMANSTPYGLASVVWTQDVKRSHRVARNINAGIVWVNCWMIRDLRTPFGGTKQSGVGREGGVDALRFFTEAKNVCIRL
ncbi:MAG: aldehyde dehydrogenase [Flavobacteriales bacterium]|nr:aldehyde dehydrogenase [Flavobacteriales bacterium]MBK6944531.1 aldehyde dehydrogenase [Flavobacteriales bacterium]MBK7241318.1 aldehyde dehydrogenase [Flavobacteriales bacterium]MBP9139233.1 aldehyde dehydrogenase [Flavobacteriales bacterium]HQV52658.1 aldehyde dehydrogenase [Flavobacteriales bacterium]